MLGASINEDGIFESWSDVFDYSNDTLFELSNLLPFPTELTGNEINIDDRVLAIINDKGYTPIDAIGLYNSESIEDRVLGFSMLVNLINDLTTNNERYVTKQERVRTFLDTHFNTKLDTTRRDNAIKNKAYSVMIQSGNNLTNWVKQTEPISLKDASDAAQLSSAGKFGKFVSNTNPSARFNLQYQNYIGKQCIGISATGIKIQSIISTYLHEMISNPNVTEDDIKSLDSRYKRVLRDGKGKKTGETEVGFFEVYDNKGKKFTLKQTQLIPNINSDLIPTETKALWQQYLPTSTQDHINEDVYALLSILITISTDNAKELLLDPINGTPELMSAYIYMVITGIPFSDAARFMTTDIVSKVSKRVKSNIMNPASLNNNIMNAINYYINGVKLDDFVTKTELYNAIQNRVYNNLRGYTITNEKGKEVRLPISQQTLEGYVANLKTIEEINEFEAEVLKWFTANVVGTKTLSAPIKQKKTKGYSSDYDEFDDYNDYEEEYDTDWDDNFGGSFSNGVYDAKPYLRRFFNSARTRLTDLQESDHKVEGSALQNLRTLREISQASKELTIIGRGGSLNQGIDTQLVNRIALETRIENFINGKLPDQLSYTDSTGNEVKVEGFDFVRFALDSDYRDALITEYSKYKESFNILEAWMSTPQFASMIKAYGTADQLLSKYSNITYKESKRLIKKLIADKIIQNNDIKAMKKVIKFMYDSIANDYLNNYEGEFTIQVGQRRILADGTDVVSDTANSFDFSSPENRATFKSLMENEILKYLKEEYKNNEFIQKLSIQGAKDDYGEVFQFLRLPLDSDSENRVSNENTYNMLVNAFNKIRRDDIEGLGMTIGDAFFMYNLIVNSNRNGSTTLTKMFVNDATDTNSLSYKYSQAISDLESVPISEEDLVFRLLDTNTEYRGLNKRFDPSTGRFQYVINNRQRYMNNFDGAVKLPMLANTTINSSRLNDNLITKLYQLSSNNLFELKLECDE